MAIVLKEEMHCKNCQEKVTENDKYCFSCGSSLLQQSVVNKKNNLSKKRMFWFKAPYFFWLTSLILFSVSIIFGYSGNLIGYFFLGGVVSFLFLVAGLYQYRNYKEAKKYATITFITLLIPLILVFGSIFLNSNSSIPVQNTTTYVKNNSNFVNIKYRDDAVDTNNGLFEYLNIKESSFVREAWYDKSNKYMIIKLDSTYYHYCGLPLSTWKSFKQSSSYGTFYTSTIKGNFDCRYNFEPKY